MWLFNYFSLAQFFLFCCLLDCFYSYEFIKTIALWICNLTEKSLVLFCYIQDWWHKSERGRIRWKNFLLSKLFLKRVTKKSWAKKGRVKIIHLIWLVQKYRIHSWTFCLPWYINHCSLEVSCSIFSSFWPFRVNIWTRGFLWHFLMMKFGVSYSLQGA